MYPASRIFTYNVSPTLISSVTEATTRRLWRCSPARSRPRRARARLAALGGAPRKKAYCFFAV